MALLHLLRTRHWTAVSGYLFFVGMMSVGYVYNLTFIQLGLVDLGRRVVGMDEGQVAVHMAYLALITCLTALVCGLVLQRSGWGRHFQLKLRLTFVVVLLQTTLTAAALLVTSEASFLTWVLLASLSLGLGVPVTFSMSVDLIPVRDRGYAAAMITAMAYFVAAVLASTWRIDSFALLMLGPMVLGTLLLGILAFWPLRLVQTLSAQHKQPAFGQGRFVRSPAKASAQRRLFMLLVLMFAVYFVDSLGFLRLTETAVYMNTAWQSPDLATRSLIGGMHVIAALIAGILYAQMGLRTLFMWIFGIFALTHLMYVFHHHVTPGLNATLTMPLLYATAVSLYTVINFALWADLSTPDSISFNAALGVALSAWTATFFSTALAIYWRLQGLPLDQHLNYVDALAMVFFLAMILFAFMRPPRSEVPA